MVAFLERPPTSLQIGALLVARELITPAQRDEALAEQARNGGTLGAILIGSGHITAHRLHEALAEHYALPFANLTEFPPKDDLLSEAELDDYLHHAAIPWQRRGDTLLIATPAPSAAARRWAEKRFGPDVELAVTSPLDILWSLSRRFEDALNERSRLQLWRMAPERSARMLFPAPAIKRFAAAAALLALAAIPFGGAMLALSMVLLQVFYTMTLGLKALLLASGLRHHHHDSSAPARTASAQDDRTLPLYTVLVPLYREQAALPQLLASLRALDYPKSRLDVKLIIEADDAQTEIALKQLAPESYMQIVRVPYSLPRTKPKACNFALTFAHGEYVTIYDAEDRPHPEQLRRAVEAFRHAPPEVVCLQARLNYYNREENLLTQLFSIEYASWFDIMLPGLERLGIPIPLGGTSNHIALSRLREVGAWDPFNVTEDADLGIRLAQSGYKTAMLDSETLEESPITFLTWLRQRSRWIKGYMATWIVHMRHPVTLYRSLGVAGFWGFQFFIGGPCLVFLLAPLFWSLSLLWAVGVMRPDDWLFPSWFLALSIANLLLGIAIHFVFSLLVIRRRGWPGMYLAAFSFPFYWILHSLASFKALWQLLFRPHFWEKTPHGISRLLAATTQKISL